MSTPKPHAISSWHTQTVIKILLIIAQLLAQDEALRAEVKTLAAHITSGGMYS